MIEEMADIEQEELRAVTVHGGFLEHDAEKWVPVFGKHHAPTITQSGMTIRRKVIPLWRGPAAMDRPRTRRVDRDDAGGPYSRDMVASGRQRCHGEDRRAAACLLREGR
jgi:hypothetical protein